MSTVKIGISVVKSKIGINFAIGLTNIKISKKAIQLHLVFDDEVVDRENCKIMIDNIAVPVIAIIAEIDEAKTALSGKFSPVIMGNPGTLADENNPIKNSK